MIRLVILCRTLLIGIQAVCLPVFPALARSPDISVGVRLIAALIEHLHISARCHRNPQQRCHLIQPLDLCAAAAHTVLAVRIVTDYQNCLSLIPLSVNRKRQDAFVIAQHRDSLLSRLQEMLFIFIIIISTGISLSIQHVQLIHHIQNVHYLFIQLLHTYLTALYSFLQRLSKKVIIEIICDTHVYIHRHVACFHRIMDSAPVGYADTLEVPLFPQDIIEQISMMAAMRSPETVISSHNAQRSGLGYRRLKCREIQLSERSLTDLCIHAHSLILLIVQGVMLHAGRHVILLDPLDQRYDHL